MDNRQIEKLEKLDGSRAGASRELAAVRLGDVKELLKATQLKSKDLAAAPTAADFNALRADIRQISEMLNALALVLQKRMRG